MAASDPVQRQAGATTAHLPHQIGARVKAIRATKGLSGRKLAAAAGVSQPFLSQLESGRTSVALVTLYRIAAALGVGAADLLPEPAEEGIEVRRAPELHRMTVSEDLGSAAANVVFRGGKRITELLDYVIEPGQYVEEWFETVGEHVVYAIEGSIRIEFDGHPDVILHCGDAIFYSGLMRSRWHGRGDSRARIILVAASPQPSEHHPNNTGGP